MAAGASGYRRRTADALPQTQPKIGRPRSPGSYFGNLTSDFCNKVSPLISPSPSSTISSVHGPLPHRRPPRTLSRAARRPPTDDQRHPTNIDVHRSITSLERPHQPDRHPRPGTNRPPPLRRIIIYGSTFVPL